MGSTEDYKVTPDEEELSALAGAGATNSDGWSTPVIAIGASVGAQEALEQLFTRIPSGCGLTFVVLMHLPPGGSQILAEMLGRYSTMPVATARDGIVLMPDSVYVLPAERTPAIRDGRLRFEERAHTGGGSHPIDAFFRVVAAEAKERAIAVVLSGFGTDGAEGVKAVKAAGGLVFIQEPDSAIDPGMPRHASATGAADFILPADQMAATIVDAALSLLSSTSVTAPSATPEEALEPILDMLRARTGHDFSAYKRSTILRRIERRMALCSVARFGGYLDYLSEHPQEAQALCQDILIGVTSFFRDPEAFVAIREKVLPPLFAGRDPQDPVRIWHPCCATGEEVYSMSMLIQEYLAGAGLTNKVQFFATDIDGVAIDQARGGMYQTGPVAVLGEERLASFFTMVNQRYQVAKGLRDQIIFAHHSLIKDPPFSRLDLLVCRNFLIYLNPDMQKRLIALFHQVLKPGAVLFLGSAESVGADRDLFAPLDAKWKIFRRLDGPSRVVTSFPFTKPTRRPIDVTSLKLFSPSERSSGTVIEKLLLARYAPPCVVVNAKYEVVHVSPRTHPFLEMSTAHPTRDLFLMAREELRPTLRAALYQAFTEERQVVFRGLSTGSGPGGTTVTLIVEPVHTLSSPERLAMIVFEGEIAGGQGGRGGEAADAVHGAVHSQAEEQLRLTYRLLQDTTEQLEATQERFLVANEELTTINEELQSTNEELHSSNEELLTSKEELQILNADLVQTNAERQEKIEELNRLNSDVENLLASSDIATLFLDAKLQVKRYTPAMAALFQLVPADMGRALETLIADGPWSDLIRDAREVLTTHLPMVREVSAGRRHYLLRIHPYWRMWTVVDGVVVSVVDISERKRAEDLLQQSETLQGLFIEYAPAALAMFDREMGYIRASRRWRNDYLLGDRDLTGVSHSEIFSEVSEEWREAHRRGMAGEVLRAEADRFVRADGSIQWIRWEVRPWYDAVGEVGGIVIFTENLSEVKQAEEALRLAKEEWERTFDSVTDLIAIIDAEHRIVRANRALANRLGITSQECVGKTCYALVHGTECPLECCPHSATMADGLPRETEVYEEYLGGYFTVTTTPLRDGSGQITGAVHVARDISDKRRAAEALRRGREAGGHHQWSRRGDTDWDNTSGC